MELISTRSFNTEERFLTKKEIISKMTLHINELRKGTKYKPVTERYISIKINKNPFLTREELYFVFKGCQKKNSYSHFFWITK